MLRRRYGSYLSMRRLDVVIAYTLLACVIRINANQNLTYHVPEESNIGYFVGNVLTDSNVPLENEKFEVTTIKDELLRVDKATGKIFVAKRIDRETICPHLSGILDESQTDSCKLDFSIHISGTWINIYIIIDDINDNVPEFSSADSEVLVVSEDAPDRHVIPVKMARDPDFGRNTVRTYELDNGLSRMFDLRINLPEDVSLILKETLDAEKVQQYSGALTACDDGHLKRQCSTQKLIINVKDENDNSPIFEQTEYRKEIKESLRINSLVIKVQATDADSGNNGKIRYYLKSKLETPMSMGMLTTDNTFYIDQNSGEIFLRHQLNAKLRQEYEFHVFASDYGELSRKTSARVVIRVADENDHKPWIKMMATQDHFDRKMTFSQNENSPVDTIIGFLKAGDEDLDENGQFECNLTENEKYFSFYMSNPANRIYDIRNKVVFDRESDEITSSNGLIPFTIKCTDQGKPSLSSESRFFVSIQDVDEHRPYYSKNDQIINLRLEENLPNGRMVYKTNVIDEDATKNVRYKIANDPKNLFTIDELSGHVIVQGLLDREEQDSVSFNIYACEEGQDLHQVDPSAIQTVNIEILDVNDNKPELIELTEFTIPENQLAYSRIIGKITVQDLDQGINGTVRFRVGDIQTNNQSPNDPSEIRKRFEVDTNTGEIKCTQRLDREEIDQYILAIEMYDIGIPSLSSTGKIRIHVLDENDNTPEWESVSIVPFISTYSSESLESWKQRFIGRNSAPPMTKSVHELGLFNASASLLPGQKVLKLFGKDRDAPENSNITFHLLGIDRLDDYDLRFLSEKNVNLHDVKEIRRFYMTFFDLNPVTGDLTVSLGPDSKGIDFGGIYEIHVSLNDNGNPSRETLGRLYMEVMPPANGQLAGAFSAYNFFFSSSSSSISFNLIILMIAMTCLVSVCLLVAIFIVRKNATKESFLRSPTTVLQSGIIANKNDDICYSPGPQGTFGNLSTVHQWAQDGLYLSNETMPQNKNGYLSPVSLKTGYTGTDTFGHYDFTGKHNNQSNMNSNSSGSDNGVYFNITSPLIQQQPQHQSLHPATDTSLTRNTDSPSTQHHHGNLRSFY